MRPPTAHELGLPYTLYYVLKTGTKSLSGTGMDVEQESRRKYTLQVLICASGTMHYYGIRMVDSTKTNNHQSKVGVDSARCEVKCPATTLLNRLENTGFTVTIWRLPLFRERSFVRDFSKSPRTSR